MDKGGAPGSEEPTAPPWLERMKRYGWPPGYLKRVLDPESKLEMFDGLEEEEDTSKNDVPKEEEINQRRRASELLSSFPMYVWAPDLETNQTFAHLPRPTSESNASGRGVESGLVEWACPVL